MSTLNDRLPSPGVDDQGLKRKRSSNDHDGTSQKPRPKSKRSKKQKRQDDDDVDLENGVNLALGRMDSQLLADYLAKQSRRFEDDLSLLELEERRIPVSALRNTTEWEKARVLENLPDFVKHFSSTPAPEKLSVAPKAKGTPHTLVVTAAGLRAADITRALRTFQTKEATVGKLFAKHIKLAEAIKFVKNTRMNFGVGTPSRIIDLLESGALSSSQLRRIVVDSSHVDQKKRGILDMKETQPPLMKLLNRPELRQRYETGAEKIDLVFF